MFIIVCNIPEQQNDLNDKEILYWIHLKDEILDFFIFKVIYFLHSGSVVFTGFFQLPQTQGRQSAYRSALICTACLASLLCASLPINLYKSDDCQLDSVVD